MRFEDVPPTYDPEEVRRFADSPLSKAWRIRTAALEIRRRELTDRERALQGARQHLEGDRLFARERARLIDEDFAARLRSLADDEKQLAADRAAFMRERERMVE